ncbi:hypothetical protein M9435_005666 [Picochlorum sp. BPE23]|nr:hypothetical protein M9435_005666 [Picochlorum sp. BPE23]
MSPIRIPVVLAVLAALAKSTLVEARPGGSIPSAPLAETSEDRLLLSVRQFGVVNTTSTSVTLQFSTGPNLVEYDFVNACYDVEVPCTPSFGGNVTGSSVNGTLPKQLSVVSAVIDGLTSNTTYYCYVATSAKKFYKCNGPVVATTTVTPVPDSQYLLIADEDGNKVEACEITGPLGTLGDCTDTTLTAPGFLTVVPTTSQSLVYVTGGTTTGVSRCSYNSQGSLLGCTDATLNGGVFSLSGPAQGVTSTDSLVTIAVSASNGEIVQCDITAPNNDLTGCLALSGAFARPTIDVAYARTSDFLYVVEEGASGGIVKCAIDPTTGRINAGTPCTNAGTGSLPPSFPNSITYAGVINGDTVFYITDQQSGGIIIKGVENSQTGDLTLSPGSFIAFPAVQSIAVDPSGTIAYVTKATTTGAVSKCEINQSNALLENCVDQSVSLVQPVGMGFIPYTN